ncbi:MAG: protein kinase [Rubrivivax sp. SCN 70-15]|nr:MAG: protein kinase [Rubrivivax sp. SCN 70-15]
MRHFGRWQLMRLLGKSERTMAWAVSDPASGQDLMLVLPRAQPIGSAALERWTQSVQRGARLRHPNLAVVVDVGVQDGWPYAAYELGDSAPLTDRLGLQGLPAPELAALAVQALQGLAFAHEGGVAHHDLQPWMLLVGDHGALRIAGLEVAGDEALHETRTASGVEPAALRAQRDAAQRDVLAFGVLLHLGLTGQPALDEADVGRVIARLPPAGRDILRLAWTTAHPVPEALRAIVNRSTDRQERQRYKNARTLLRALEGWLQAEADGGGGPIVLLLDRLRAVGALPLSPGAGERAAKLALMERERTNELAEVVLQDLALAFELLRAVNTAQVRGAQVAGSGPVLTVRRAIAMLGLDGVRRAALSLRPWPGPMDAAGAAELTRLLARVKRAARVAVALRPPGYDAEVVTLITMLQNLGRLLVQYHFADEAQQIRRLMQPAPALRPGEPDDPGMSEEGASFAVLGADVEALGAAVARHWGLDDSVLHMIRRLPVTTPARVADGDDDLLRALGSCANEVVDASALPVAQQAGALQRVVQRYARTLGVTLKDLQEALLDRPAPARAEPAATADLKAEVRAER